MQCKSIISCVHIYILLDPETLSPFYVGQTAYYHERMRRHSYLRNRAFTPEVVAVVAPEMADDEERFWITSLRALGYEMENKTTGGQHAYVMANEVREKIAATHRGMTRSDEARASMSAARLGIVLSEETKERIGLAVRARWQSPESAERMRQGLLKAQALPRRNHQTSETRAKISAAMKGIPKSAETRARMSAARWARNQASSSGSELPSGS